MKIKRVLFIEKVLGIIFSLLFLYSIVNANQGSLQRVWYGPLIVTTSQGFELIYNLSGPNCEVKALLSFNFDDGYKETITNAYPIFEKYKVNASVYIITSKIGEFEYLELNDIKFLQSKSWEIGSHSITHRDLTQISIDQAREEILGSKQILENLGFEVSGFVSPYGKYNSQTLEIIKESYNYHRSSIPGLNYLPLKEAGLGSRWELYYFEVKYDTAPEEIFAWLRQIERTGGWLIVTFHRIGDGTGRWWWTRQNLERTLNYARETLNFCTYEEFINGTCKPR